VCEGNDTSCFAVTQFSPSVVRNTQVIKLSLFGARLPPQSIQFNGAEYAQTINTTTLRPNFAEFTIPGVDLGGEPFRMYFLNVSGFDPVKGIISYELNVTLFDRDVSLQSMGMDMVMVGDSLRMEFVGQRLFNFDDVNCVWVDGRDTQLSTVTLYNSTAGWCMTPVKTLSRSVGSQLYILYGKTVDVSLFIPRNESNSFLLMYYEYAPVLLRSNFSFTGSEINVYFEKPVQYNPSKTLDLTKRNLCNLFINQTSTGSKLFWLTTSDCNVVFPNPSAMSIRISPRYIRNNIDIIPGLGDEVTVLVDAFGSRGAFYSLTATGSAVMDAPESAVVPVITVIAPNLLDACPDLTFDLSKTSGRGGRPFVSGTFSVVTSFDDSNVTAVSMIMTQLEAFKNQIMTNTNPNLNPFEFSLSSSMLPDGSYTFTFTLTNFLLQQGTISHSVTKSSLLHIPMIVLFQPGTLNTEVDNQFGPKVFYPCGDSFGLVLTQWVSTDGLYVISKSAASRRKLVTEPYALLPGTTYSFTLMSWYEFFPNEVYNYTFTVETVPRQIEVTIGLGLSIPQTGTIRLKADIKDNGASPGQVKRSLSMYTFKWYCITQDFDDCIDSRTGLPIELPNTQLLLYPNVMEANTYYFFVVVSLEYHGAEVSTTSARVPVVVKEEDFISVSVDTSDVNPGAFSNFALLSYLGNVANNAILSYTWSSEENCDGLVYTRIDLRDSSNTLATGKSLKFVPGALSAGSQYCFGLTVYDSANDKSGFGYATIQVKQRPSSGYCDIIGNNSGTEFSTIFRLACSGWETDMSSYPLKYSWDIARSSDGNLEWSSISPLSELPVVSLQLPKGNYTLRATISDLSESENDELQLLSIIVNPSTDPDAAKTFASSSLTNFEKTGDVAGALSNMASFANSDVSLPSKKRSADEQTMKAKAIDFMRGLVESGTVYLGTSGTSSALLSTFTKLAGRVGSIPPELQGVLFESVEFLVSKVSANAADKNDCFGDSEAGNVIQILDVLLRSSESLPNDTVITKLFSVADVINTCLIRTLSCGQVPFSADSTSVKRSVGVIDPSTERSACGFDFADLSAFFTNAESFDENGCVQFTCGETRSKVYVENTNNTVSPIIKDLSFVNTNVSQANGIVFSIPIDADFAAQYNLTTYDLASPGNNNWDNHKVKPVCAYYAGDLGTDHQQGNWTSDGCEAISLIGNSLTCRCTHLTSFGVKVVRIIEPPKTSTSTSQTATSSPTQTSEKPDQEGGSSVVTIGAVAGVVTVAAVLAVVGYRRRKRKQKKTDQDKNLVVLPPGVLQELKDQQLPKEGSQESLTSQPELEEKREPTPQDVQETPMDDNDDDEQHEDEEEQEDEINIKATTTTKKAILPPMEPESRRILRTLGNLPAYVLPPTFEEHIKAASQVPHAHAFTLDRAEEDDIDA
jgi:hypothetical protein